jgi:hypothetical protein
MANKPTMKQELLTINPEWETAELEDVILVPKPSAFVAPSYFEKRPSSQSQPGVDVYFDTVFGKRYDKDQKEIPRYISVK